MSKVEVNREFYDQLYRARNPWISILHSRISFDQQSKSKINLRMLKDFLKDKFGGALIVLDYGFGHGSLLLKYPRNHKLYGCDISEEAVRNFPRVAACLGKNVLTATVDGFDSSFSDVRFDIITLSHIIEHVDDDLGLVKRLTRKLSDAGVVLINIPINEVWKDPKHVRPYDLHYMKKLMDACGLKILHYTEADKLTSFFLIQEKVRNAGPLGRLLIKVLRAVFAVVPLSFTQLFERVFLKRHHNQQLIVLSVKA